jgi:hypothetical protein
LLEARAQFDALERAVYLRVAEHAGRIYLDLADERWRAVEIGAEGWRVIASPPDPLGQRQSPRQLRLRQLVRNCAKSLGLRSASARLQAGFV